MKKLYLRVLKVINIMIIAIIFTVIWYEYYGSRIRSPFFRKGNWVVIGIFTLTYYLFVRIYSGFSIRILRKYEIIFSQVLSLIFANFLIYMIIWLLSKDFPNPFYLIMTFLLEAMYSLIWTFVAVKLYFHHFPARKTLVISDADKSLINLFYDYALDERFDLLGEENIKRCISDFSILDQSEIVFLHNIHSHERNQILKYCVENSIECFIVPRIGDVLMGSADMVHLFHLPILRVRKYDPSIEYLFVKRIMDIVVSIIGMLILSPVILVTAISIKVCDGGDVFYRQIRLGKDGKKFKLIKFRSMKMDAESDGVARLSSGASDDRVTRVGRFIRATRIDEIPQLINIFKGDMSLVGPRPERPDIAKQYEEYLPEFKLRLQAKAGLTGYAQVYGKYNTKPYDKLLMDLMYMNRFSIIEDIKIIFATVKILFSHESTEGVEKGMETA